MTTVHTSSTTQFSKASNWYRNILYVFARGRGVCTARRFDGKSDGGFFLEISASAFTVTSVWPQTVKLNKKYLQIKALRRAWAFRSGVRIHIYCTVNMAVSPNIGANMKPIFLNIPVINCVLEFAFNWIARHWSSRVSKGSTSSRNKPSSTMCW